MKRYGQICGVAKALDVVGDRWTLLVVRDLLLGPLRFAELRAELAGIPSNLLSERLRRLEEAGLVRRLEPEGYELTPEGKELEPVVFALGDFGSRYLAAGVERGDRGHPRWAVLSCKRRFTGSRRAGTLELEIDGSPFEVELRRKQMDVRAGRARRPDAVLRVPLAIFVARMHGRARTGGDVEGDADLVAAFFESLRA
jgi:DNA-binding HxlR family transcriptional regulator